jgi:hypothetical protein
LQRRSTLHIQRMARVTVSGCSPALQQDIRLAKHGTNNACPAGSNRISAPRGNDPVACPSRGENVLIVHRSNRIVRSCKGTRIRTPKCEEVHNPQASGSRSLCESDAPANRRVVMRGISNGGIQHHDGKHRLVVRFGPLPGQLIPVHASNNDRRCMDVLQPGVWPFTGSKPGLIARALSPYARPAES